MFAKEGSLTRKSLLPLLFAIALVVSACGGTPPAGDTGGEPTAAEAAQSGSGAVAGACANPLYPVVQGATHVYSSTTTDLGTSSFTQTITEVRADGFTLTSQFDELTLIQEWSCSAEGIAALDYAGGSSAALSTSGLNGQFETTDMTGVTLPASLAPGATWSQTFTIAGTMDMGEAGEIPATGGASIDFEAIGLESVTVPAGSFNAMRIESHTIFTIQITMQGVEIPVTYEGDAVSWYVEGIGWVKTDDVAIVEGAEPINTIIEMQSYTIP